MNSLVKSAIASVLALGATSAFASLGAPDNDSSDLVLIVENTTTQATYALDTGISIDSVLPTGSLVTGAVMNTSIPGFTGSIAASATLQSFLASNPASGDAWTLEAGEFNGAGNAATNGNSKPAGAAKSIFTSALGTTNNSVLSGKVLTNLEAFENDYNGDVTQTNGGLFPLTTASETTAAAYTNSAAEPNAASKYNMLGANDLESFGTSYQLFGFTGNGGTGTLQSYILGTASLAANGLLTITGNTSSSPVPLPAAVWLFGSGLMGLVGVSRRRKASV